MNSNTLTINHLAERSLAHKVGGWLRRYLPAELSGTAAALLGISIVVQLEQGAGVIALTGAWCEVVGFYTAMVLQEWIAHRRLTPATPVNDACCFVQRNNQRPATTGWRTTVREQTAFIGQLLRNLFFEFGIAEALDPLLLRPAFLAVAMQLIPDLPLAVVAGKLAADLVFYTLAICSFELRKKITSV